MAIIKPTPLGRISGRVGNAIFYRVRGRTCVRSCPLSYRDANTPAQQLQRMKLKDIATFYHVLKPTVISIIWRKFALGTSLSGYNLFVRENIRAFDGMGGIIFENLHFSKGKLPSAENMKLVRGSDRVVRLTWENLSACSRKRMTDPLMVVVVAADASFYLLTPPGFRVNREQKWAEIPLEEQEQPQHVYYFFAAEKMDGFSNDIHFEIQ